MAERLEPRAIQADPDHQDDEEGHPCQARQHLDTEHLDPGEQGALLRSDAARRLRVSTPLSIIQKNILMCCRVPHKSMHSQAKNRTGNKWAA